MKKVAARQFLTCKHCGQKFINGEKTILCGGKCKSLFHLKCLPLNKAERNVLSMGRHLWWLCDFCSSVDSASIVSVLSGLISTISILNKEISALKEVVRCSHTTLRNGELEATVKCSCQLSHKRTPVKTINHNLEELTQVTHPKDSSFIMKLGTSVPVEVKVEERMITNGTTSPNFPDTISNVICENDIKLESEETFPQSTAGSAALQTNNLSKKGSDTVKFSRRSKRPSYKVDDFYYY